MDQPKEKIDSKALAATIIFHGVILLWLLYFGLSTPLPLPEEEGVLVTFGTTDLGTGPMQPQTAPPPPPQPQQVSRARPAERFVTQDTEESIALPDAPRTQPQRQQRETPAQPRPVPQIGRASWRGSV